jgi:16S rRNA (cytidine1402-2'-O)-methyltransferase
VEKIEAGSLYIVSTPIGNLADITYRAIHILKNVDLIAAEDTRTSGILLNHYEVRTKMKSYHSYNLKSMTPILIDLLKRQKSIALISDAGTPGISDPGYQLVNACIENNIRVIPIPGASAFLSALVVSGLAANEFSFEGFLPVKKGRQTKLKKLAGEHRTLIFYESPHRIIKTIKNLYEYFGDRRCVIGREITKKYEEFKRGSFSEILTALETGVPKGEFVLLVEGRNKKIN